MPVQNDILMKIFGSLNKKLALKYNQNKQTKSKGKKGQNAIGAGGCSSTKAETTRKRRKPLDKETEMAATASDANADENATTSAKTKPKKKAAKVATHKSPQKDGGAVECSRIPLSTPPPLDHFNNVFDHLRNNSHNDEMILNKESPDKTTPAEKSQNKQKTSAKKVHNTPVRVAKKKLVVRVARLKLDENSNHTKKNITTSPHFEENEVLSSTSCSSKNDVSLSNMELITWLKHFTGNSGAVTNNGVIFNEMKICK